MVSGGLSKLSRKCQVCFSGVSMRFMGLYGALKKVSGGSERFLEFQWIQDQGVPNNGVSWKPHSMEFLGVSGSSMGLHVVSDLFC